MAQHTKVAVIMGVYNAGCVPELQAAIESIFAQTFEDFEFIICDDGSTDNTFEVLKNLCASDSRVKLIHSQENRGLAGALNLCLAQANAKYIARMDADDISGKTRLQEEYDFLEKNPKYALVGTNAYLMDDKKIWGKRVYPERPDKKSFLWNSPFIHPSIMMRKSVYDVLGGYRVSRETKRMEDYDLFMRLYEAGYTGYNMQKFLLNYREDREGYKKRKYRYRIDEFLVRIQGYHRLGLLPKGYLYACKPLIVGLIPIPLLRYLKK